MNASNETDFEERTCAAQVRLGDLHSIDLQSCWKSLSARQELPHAIYQSPSYFQYLTATEDPRQLGLLTVRTQSQGHLVGLSPVQKLALDIPFSIGERTLFKKRISCLRILGSEPMAPKTHEAHDQLFALIAKQYSDLSAIEMDKVSVDGFLWEYLFSSPFIRDNYFVHVLHGVRDCHFVHLPPSLEEYRRRLGRKLRYNFERQERLIEKHLEAPLVLELLNREEDVPAIIKAIQMLGSDPDDLARTQQRLIAATRAGFHYCFMLRAGDRIVGMISGIKSNGVYRIHKFYYDKRLMKYSPGTALWQQVLRYLIEEPTFKSVDMGYGTPVYPFRRINTVYKRGKVILFRRTVANRCLIGAVTAFSAAVNFVKTRTGSMVVNYHRQSAKSSRRPEDKAAGEPSCIASTSRRLITLLPLLG